MIKICDSCSKENPECNWNPNSSKTACYGYENSVTAASFDVGRMTDAFDAVFGVDMCDISLKSNNKGK